MAEMKEKQGFFFTRQKEGEVPSEGRRAPYKTTELVRTQYQGNSMGEPAEKPHSQPIMRSEKEIKTAIAA